MLVTGSCQPSEGPFLLSHTENPSHLGDLHPGHLFHMDGAALKPQPRPPRFLAKTQSKATEKS